LFLVVFKLWNKDTSWLKIKGNLMSDMDKLKMNFIKSLVKMILFLKFISFIYNLSNLLYCRVKYPRGLKINGRLKIKNKGSILLGSNLTINSGKNHNIIGGDIRTNIVVRNGAIFELGDFCGISNSTFVCTRRIIIGEKVLIGGSCRFYDTDFHSLELESRMSPYVNSSPDENIKSSGIIVKYGAWIGGSSIILKGVTIGTHSIIGAGSVVSKDIPDHEIWAGNPIKFIRKIKVT
jgi:acetyltransferase-like isoleucine patch superfamily enzyme